MPRYLPSEPVEAILRTLGGALDFVDCGLVLLNRAMRASFINRQFWAMWNLDLDALPAGPTFQALMDFAASHGSYRLANADRPGSILDQEAMVRAGSVPLTQIHLADQRRILFRCIESSDGGRLLTYLDVSHVVEQEISDAVERLRAELRFNSEMLEEQASHLASLAETAEENAQKAEAARALLEIEITERRQLEIKLRRMATIDGLTGALNRGEFLASAQARMDQGSDVIVLMLDIDHFKTINDSYGHAGGDCALQKFVMILRHDLREVDLLGRLGGEEFAVALLNTQHDVAVRMAERLRVAIMETPVAFGPQYIPMTVSIGMAIQAAGDHSIEQIIARADDALYHAKRSGRNRVVIHGRAAAA
jgi:diguanylate cyclase (GGDEF)-like protein